MSVGRPSLQAFHENPCIPIVPRHSVIPSLAVRAYRGGRVSKNSTLALRPPEVDGRFSIHDGVILFMTTRNDGIATESVHGWGVYSITAEGWTYGYRLLSASSSEGRSAFFGCAASTMSPFTMERSNCRFRRTRRCLPKHGLAVAAAAPAPNRKSHAGIQVQ
jgi:hypothetical protein